jgi:alpha-L-fucosidase
MVRSLQPGIVINNRADGDCVTEYKDVALGQYYTPEGYIPREGVLNGKGDPVPWETCASLNAFWGIGRDDKNFKSPGQLVKALINCVSKDGNLLLNVGPEANGEIPEEPLEILADIGKWMKVNGDSIYSCGSSTMEKPEWGRYTQKGNKLYAHILDRGINDVVLKGLDGKVKNARALSDEFAVALVKPIDYVGGYSQGYFDGDIFLVLFKNTKYPDETDIVVELELDL